jgi:hypothetical protein
LRAKAHEDDEKENKNKRKKEQKKKEKGGDGNILASINLYHKSIEEETESAYSDDHLVHDQLQTTAYL